VVVGVDEVVEGAMVMMEEVIGDLEPRRSVGQEEEDLERLLMNLMLRWRIIGAVLGMMGCKGMRLLVVLPRVPEVLLLSRLVEEGMI